MNYILCNLSIVNNNILLCMLQCTGWHSTVSDEEWIQRMPHGDHQCPYVMLPWHNTALLVNVVLVVTTRSITRTALSYLKDKTTQDFVFIHLKLLQHLLWILDHILELNQNSFPPTEEANIKWKLRWTYYVHFNIVLTYIFSLTTCSSELFSFYIGSLDQPFQQQQLNNNNNNRILPTMWNNTKMKIGFT